MSCDSRTHVRRLSFLSTSWSLVLDRSQRPRPFRPRCLEKPTAQIWRLASFARVVLWDGHIEGESDEMPILGPPPFAGNTVQFDSTIGPFVGYTIVSATDRRRITDYVENRSSGLFLLSSWCVQKQTCRPLFAPRN